MSTTTNARRYAAVPHGPLLVHDLDDTDNPFALFDKQHDGDVLLVEWAGTALYDKEPDNAPWGDAWTVLFYPLTQDEADLCVVFATAGAGNPAWQRFALKMRDRVLERLNLSSIPHT